MILMLIMIDYDRGGSSGRFDFCVAQDYTAREQADYREQSPSPIDSTPQNHASKPTQNQNQQQETGLLEAWRDYVTQYDPDAFILFQVRDTFGALVARFGRLQVDGGGMHLCRLERGRSKPLAVKGVVQCRFEGFKGWRGWGW